MSNGPSLAAGELYGGSNDGLTPLVRVLDARPGDLLLDGAVDYRLSGLGQRAVADSPLGDSRLAVGMRHAIVCVALE